MKIMRGLLSVGLLFSIIIMLTGCSEAGKHYRNGKKYFENGNYDEAAKYFAFAIDDNPNRAEYYIDYGMTLIGLSRYDEAIEEFDRIIMDKKIAMVLGNNKRALRGKGIAYFNMLNFREAIKQFDDALNISVLSELDMDILYYKGKALMSSAAYKEAAEIYTDIISRFGEEAHILADRAYTYQRTGEYEKGLDDYDKAIALEANNYEYYFRKFHLLREIGRDAEANELLSQASQIEVKTKADKFNLAKVHFYQGLFDQAFPEFSEGFANGFVDAYFYIGEIYTNKKDYSTAKYYYEKYIEEEGRGTPEVYNQVASCLIKMEEYEQAIPYLETGMEYANSDMMRVLLKNEIIVYERLGDFEKALAKLQSYIAVYPKDEDARREEAFVMSRLPNESSDLSNQ